MSAGDVQLEQVSLTSTVIVCAKSVSYLFFYCSGALEGLDRDERLFHQGFVNEIIIPSGVHKHIHG